MLLRCLGAPQSPQATSQAPGSVDGRQGLSLPGSTGLASLWPPPCLPHPLLILLTAFWTPQAQSRLCSQPLLCLGCPLSSPSCKYLLILQIHGLPLSPLTLPGRVNAFLPGFPQLYPDSPWAPTLPWGRAHVPQWQRQIC